MFDLNHRAICEFEFQQYEDKEKIYKFCSPKVLRLLEVLKQFKPNQPESEDAALQASQVESSTSIAMSVQAMEEKLPGEKSSHDCKEAGSSAVTPSEDQEIPTVESKVSGDVKEEPVENTAPKPSARRMLIQIQTKLMKVSDNLSITFLFQHCLVLLGVQEEGVGLEG